MHKYFDHQECGVDTSFKSVLKVCGQALADGELERAEAVAQEYLAEHGEDCDIRGVIGTVKLEQGDFQSAIVEFNMAVKWAAVSGRSPSPDIYFHLGLAQQKSGLLTRACQSWVQAVQINPTHEDAVINCVQSALQLQNWELALAVCQTALQAGFVDVRLWVWSGHALAKLGRDEESAEAYSHALELSPRDVSVRYMHALALRDSRQFDLARRGLEAVLLLAPEHADAAFEAAQLDLMNQKWQSGFALWEFRLQRSLRLLPENLPGALWDGVDDPKATLLLQAEQGFGDTLQFLRYAPIARKRVGKVILRLHKELVRLVQSWCPDLQVVEFDAEITVDIHAPLLSLPHILGVYSPCPEEAFYLASEKRGSALHAPRVGLVWAGSPTHHNDARRSAGFTAFKNAFSGLVDIEFVHFQFGANRTDLAAWPNLRDGTDGVVDFCDTARRLQTCDLVVTVDTAVAHLAGALAVPTWVLVPDVPDWRWGQTGENTPWYPNMRVMRQSMKNDWDELLSRVRSELLVRYP